MRVKTSVHRIFITGGTGYMGRHLIPGLLKRGRGVKALVRKGSEKKLPQNCPFALGNALEKESYAQHVPPADTFVQLLGVPSINNTKITAREMFLQRDGDLFMYWGLDTAGLTFFHQCTGCSSVSH